MRLRRLPTKRYGTHYLQGYKAYQHGYRNRTQSKKAQAACIEVNVSYAWAGDHGLLAVIDGAAKDLADTGQTYIAPTKLPQNHPGILAGNPHRYRSESRQ